MLLLSVLCPRGMAFPVKTVPFSGFQVRFELSGSLQFPHHFQGGQ